jgi:hypothetical protein
MFLYLHGRSVLSIFYSENESGGKRDAAAFHVRVNPFVSVVLKLEAT